jgi:hypothetical protein
MTHFIPKPFVKTDTVIVKTGTLSCKHSYTRSAPSNTYRQATCLRCGRQTVTRITMVR